MGDGNKKGFALPSGHLCTWWDGGTPAAQGPALMVCQLDRPDLLALSYRYICSNLMAASAPPGRHYANLTVSLLPTTIHVLSHAGPCSQSP